MITWVKKKKFDGILHEYLDNLFQLAYMRCGNRELAEDLVQDTCIKAYQSYISKNEEITNAKSWLFRILINTHIDYTRKKQFNTIEIEDFDFVDKKSPSEDLERNVFYGDLRTALKELDKDQRVIIYLSDINEYSYKEISELIKIPLGTVMSRLHRARQTLRKSLSKKGYSESLKSGEK